MLSDYNRRVVRTNLLIVLAGAVAFGMLAKLNDGSVFVFFGVLIVLQALVNAVLGLVHSFGKSQGTAAGYWLSALLVLIIGPGSCGLAAALIQ
ncbi:hypothetical protein [Hymenobacter jeollabukensis]|uniref:Uncharacterized protein n=1 Tax=Hymenobacter jeollabukensis TaxID=2025313 RepID=A0A5R8WNB8_9BACT|nr:hypothetical protein [Hymenobacter jeollabukensis]TLM91205.1 hypothetical protein FDY95_16560 [Hymenobacter jeollabukensis]